MKIGALAAATGVTPASIRFYEAEGLLPAPARTESNYREYTAAHVERLHFIRRCRSLDMEQGEIRALLALRDAPDGDCGGVNEILDAHLGHVRQRVRELRALEAELRALRDQCGGVDNKERCGILRELDGASVPVPRGAGRHVRGVHR